MDPNSEEEAAAPVEPNSSSSGKFVVKLKHPAAENQEKSHYCKKCNKGFTSGKALGGHMSSAHVQANKVYSEKKLVSKKNHHRRFSGAAGQLTCNICGRPFKSEKSLFGHMRCHPERCYRGMDPPEPETSSEESSGGSPQPTAAPAAEIGWDLKSWPAGVKRGRGPMGVFMRAPGEEEGNHGNALASVHDIVRIVGNGPGLKRRRQNSGLDSHSDFSSEGVKTAAEILAEMGGDAKRGKVHTCDLCNASFYSDQALGGHSSSHTKIKLNIVNKADFKLQSKNTLVDGRDGGGDSSVGREKVVAGFDLNLMPEDEEEEEEEGRGRGRGRGNTKLSFPR